jgi:ABC-2 type transport system permease protein
MKSPSVMSDDRSFTAGTPPTASATPTDEGGPSGGLTLEQLAASDGLAVILATAAAFIGVVALSVFAISIASEYSQGTLRNLLVRQPRRVRLLAGKLLALASFTTIAVLIAGVAAVAVALLVAPTQDISTSAWFTSAGWTALAGGLGNLLLATLGWGGTEAVTYGWAGLLLDFYAVVAVVAGTTLFTRRGVAT